MAFFWTKGVILVYYLCLFIMLIVSCYHSKWKRYHVLLKTGTSLGFLAMALLAWAELGFVWEAVLPALMLPGFLFCFAGDVGLALYDRKPANGKFLIGLSLFLLGHVLFLLSLYQFTAFSWTDLIFPVLMTGAAFGLTRLKRMDVQKMGPCILAYAFFVSMFCGKGVQTALLFSSQQGLWLGTGAVLFLLSDLILLFVFFYHPFRPSGKFWNLLTYYGGMMCLALSLS
ncbi:lysoplasmalogenase family protein [Massiliimalia timonensis]|uniref:lysoplasmalogenase family protein n=1 Tax=Massiliimalia timonensis TaxID=1987501 RepID=UPI00189CA86B|nr:lysoplasmalogenase family protein [Massiliimalia timonensis]